MNIANSKIIKLLDRITGAVFLFTLLLLFIKIFTNGAPSLSHSKRGYTVNNIQTKPFKTNTDTIEADKRLFNWFNSTTVVQPHNRALVDLRFRSNKQLFHPLAISFQVMYYLYFVLIMLSAWQLKMFFGALCRNEIFTSGNTRRLMLIGIFFMLIPIINSLQREFFIKTINTLRMNDSSYQLDSHFNFLSSETVFGLMMIVFSLVFKVGADVQKENESFI